MFCILNKHKGRNYSYSSFMLEAIITVPLVCFLLSREVVHKAIKISKGPHCPMPVHTDPGLGSRTKIHYNVLTIILKYLSQTQQPLLFFI